MNKWLSIGVTPTHIQQQQQCVTTPPKAGPKKENILQRKLEVLTNISRLKVPYFCAQDVADACGYKVLWFRAFIREINTTASIFVFSHTVKAGYGRGAVRYYTLSPDWKKMLFESFKEPTENCNA